MPASARGGIGVASGPAYVGSIQAVDRAIWSALGNTTNLAARLQGLTRDEGASVAVDEGLTRDRMIELMMQMRGLGANDMAFFTVPIKGIGTSADGQSIVLLDRPAFDELMAAVREDRVAEYLEANPDAVDTLGGAAP